MKYAIIKNGGHQYKVEEGQILEVEKLDSTEGSYVFEEVLLLVDGDKVELGMPTVAGIKVFADVVSEVKGEKIEVFKYKSKSRYRKHTGHRQKYTQIKITGIGAKAVSSVAPKKEKAAPTEVVAKVAPVKKSPTKKTAATVSPRSSKSVAGKKVAK